MATGNPKVQTGFLILPQSVDGGTDRIEVGSDEWFDWLEGEEHRTFYFENGSGTFTARKETRANGLYWYAYRRKQGKLQSAYLGRSEELSEERLVGVAQTLSEIARSASKTRTLEVAEPVEPAPQLIPLVTTKLYIPPLRPSLVSRPRLVEILNRAVTTHKLTLISASPGFGKTTLLSEWVAQLKDEVGSRKAELKNPIHPSSFLLPTSEVAWVSLDEGDNDPARFLAYCIAALETLHKGVGKAALEILYTRFSPSGNPASSPEATLEAVLTALVNSITTQISGKFALVLDDYNLINAALIHKAVAFLLEHMPSQMHLVIASRGDVTTLPLARLRARNQLTELHAAELRFTPEEVTAFLNQVMQLELSAPEVAQLAARTEGWITGLQLTALSLQKRKDQAAGNRDFIKDFTGTPRFVLDYLTEEVLEQQPETVRNFLLETSLLDRLTASLCEAVTGRSDGQLMLERLEQANLFLIPLDDEQHWYRYHQIFAEFLRNRLQRIAPGQINELHRRASRWFEQQNLIPEAIKHSLAADDFERAAKLIDQVSQATLRRGELITLSGWLKALPEELLNANPDLSLSYAWVLLMNGSIEGGERCFTVVEQNFGSLSPSRLQEARTLQTLLAAFKVDLARFNELAGPVPAPATSEDSFWRSVQALTAGLAHDIRGETAEAIKAYQEAGQLNQDGGNQIIALFAISQLGDLYLVQGKLHKAMEIYYEALQLAESLPISSEMDAFKVTNIVHYAIGRVLYEWNDLEQATYQLNEVIESEPALVQISILIQTGGYISLARVRQAQERTQEATELMDKGIRMTLAHSLSWFTYYIEAYQAKFFLDRGNLTAASEWAAQYLRRRSQPSSNPAEPMEMAGLGELQEMMLARVWIAQGKYSEALTVLEALRQASESAGRMAIVLETLMLESLILDNQGLTLEALTKLSRSLSIAEPEGYLRTFLDEGAPLAKLLQKFSESDNAKIVADSGVSTAYLNKLLGLLGVGPAFSSVESSVGSSRSQLSENIVISSLVPSLVTPLNGNNHFNGESFSTRELELLNLIAAGLSNQEIARKLVITVNTVKWHLYHLYGKLDVRTRVQAVSRAKELNLI